MTDEEVLDRARVDGFELVERTCGDWWVHGWARLLEFESEARMSHQFSLDVNHEGLEAVVRVGGDVDMSSAGHLLECLQSLDDRVVTVDTSRVTFMDTSAISALISVQNRIRQRAGKLVLYGLPAPQVQLLELHGLRDFFDNMVPD